MVGGAHLHRPRIGVQRVDVMVMDQTPAGAGSVVEEFPNDAVVARQIPPPLSVVHRSM